MVAGSPPAPVTTAAVAAPVVLTLQLVAVRPVLNLRSDRVLAGETAPRSHAHLVHIALAVLGVLAPATG